MKKSTDLTILSLCLLYFFSFPAVSSQNVCSVVRDAYVLAQDGNNTFLGVISNKYDSKSIFNDYGDHGSKYASDSIWNEYGNYGGKFGGYSPFNKFSSTPPMIVKNNSVIGYLSSNSAIGNSINPSVLKAICEDEI